MKKVYLKHIFAALLCGILIVIDQVSKLHVRKFLDGGKEIVIIPNVFKFISHKNTGAAWGLFSNSTIALAASSIVILLLVVAFYIVIPIDEKRYTPLRICCVFVSAGAIGNMIDRFSLKYVVDFLYFELIDFPVFNIADCYITVSMFLLVILILFKYKNEDFSRLSFRNLFRR